MQSKIVMIAGMLAARVNALVAELLPAGQRERHEWRCGSLAGERGRSLAVHLSGPRAGVWSDFASGESGDALDLVAAVLYRGDVGDALVWARRWLGVGDTAAPEPQQARQPAAVETVDTEAEGRRAAALRMFLDGQQQLAGTAAAEYLAARGIDFAELGRQPKALRFHPALWNVESGRHWPAMLAAVTGADGQHQASHRTWLGKDEAGIWRKAPLRDAKKSLGSVAGGCVRLWRGASGKPLAQAPEGETVAIAEGIETALSVALACPELRVLSAVSLGNMAKVALPAAVRTVIVCADDDGDNDKARHALDRAVQTFLAQGRAVRIARPPGGHGDFNDVLLAVDA